MTPKKKTASGAGSSRNLKLKKETVKDLDAKGKASGVKGGMIAVQETKGKTCTCGPC